MTLKNGFLSVSNETPIVPLLFEGSVVSPLFDPAVCDVLSQPLVISRSIEQLKITALACVIDLKIFIVFNLLLNVTQHSGSL
jgi:hypothetical protein